MAGSWRPLAVRASAAILAAASGLISAGAGVQAASPLAMTVRVGYHNAVKQGQWMPIVVDVTNNGPSLDGMLEIQTGSSLGGPAGPPTGVAVYHLPLSLGAGATKHIRTYVLQDQSGSLTTRVIDHGRVIESQNVSAGNTVGSLIGVLSDRPGALDGLATVRVGGFSAGLSHLSSDELPDTGLLLRPFDLLAIDDFATDTLTSSQRTALADYVTNGGALLLGTGGSWHKTLAGLPPSIVPMQVTGSTTLAATKALGGVVGVEVVTGTLTGSRSWFAEGNQPLLVEKLVGSGTVMMATFDWNQDLIAGWSGTPAILRQVFVRSTYGLGSSPSMGFGKFNFVSSVAQKGGSLSQVLNNVPSLDLPAWWIVGGLVLVYVLLVGPINYVVLRAINRRALAWVTVPVISIAASGVAYGSSVLTKGRSVQASEVAIVHIEQGWDHAYQETYLGILTPTRGDFDVSVSGKRMLISPIPNYSAPNANQSLIRVDTSSNAVSLPGMTAFTLRGFATEELTGASPLVAQAQLVGGKLTGTVQNRSTIRFTDAVIIAGNAYQKFDALAPGATVTFSLTPAAANPFGGGGPPAYSQIYQGGYYGPMPQGGSSDEQRENQTKQMVLSTLPLAGLKGNDRASVPTFVAWTKQPIQDITVNGSHPRAYAETAVVLTVPVTQIGAGALPAGVVSGRLVDVDGDAQPGGPMPGMLSMQKGSVTYSFTPPLGPGLRLSNVSFSTPGGLPMKGALPGPSGTVAKAKAQIWDWSQSAWTEVPYTELSSTSVPDSAINPATGEMMLKVLSDGYFNSSWLSLTGDVK
jgi:hypothetical protein